MLRQARHQLPYASRPRASQRMKPTLSVIGLESLWIVVTVLLECIQKESWIDWSELGAMTPVKDQGQCGSCWAYSLTEGIEFTIYMAEGTLPELAVQQIISRDKTLRECQGELANSFRLCAKHC